MGRSAGIGQPAAIGAEGQGMDQSGHPASMRHDAAGHVADLDVARHPHGVRYLGCIALDADGQPVASRVGMVRDRLHRPLAVQGRKRDGGGPDIPRLELVEPSGGLEAGDDREAVGAVGQRVDRVGTIGVPRPGSGLYAAGDVPDAQRAVRASRGQPAAVGAERDRTDRGRLRPLFSQGAAWPEARRIPEDDRAIGASRGQDAAVRVEGQAAHRISVADRLGLVDGGREHPGRDIARRRADQAGDAKDRDVSATDLDAEAGDGQERLALSIGPGRDGHRVDDPGGASPDHRPDRPGQPGILVEVPDLHHLVLAAREQGDIVLPEEAPHPRMVAPGLDHEDRHPEVPHLVLRPGRPRRNDQDGDRQPHLDPPRAGVLECPSPARSLHDCVGHGRRTPPGPPLRKGGMGRTPKSPPYEGGVRGG